jgi:hypothetical protein
LESSGIEAEEIGQERVLNIDPLLVLLITAGSGERRTIGRFDSVNLSAGIQINALIGRGRKAPSGSEDLKNG